MFRLVPLIALFLAALFSCGSCTSVKTLRPQDSKASDGTKPFRKPWDTFTEPPADVPQVTETQEIDVQEETAVGEDGNPVKVYQTVPDTTADIDTRATNVSQAGPANESLVVRQYPPLAPCTCYFQESCGCVCREPISWEEFQILPQNFVSCPAFTLALRGGEFHSFPPDYFYRVGDVREFVLDVSGINFQYLLDPSGVSSPFSTVTFDTSAYIRIHQVSVSRDWNWAGFYELAPTRPLAYCEIQVVESTVAILTADFGTICQGAVTVVNVNSCGMMALENRVFVPFYKLNEVDLSNNRLRVMLRSYFSQPANELEVISLAYNDIRNLPNNMFTGMPSLRIVDLRGNPITVLDETTFRPIFRNVQIYGLETLPLTCDCRSRWLKEPAQLCGVNTFGLAGAVCQSPRRLQGYSFFNDTLPKDLTC